MKNEGVMYYADRGNLIVRKNDDFVMGDAICLGENDNIKNYVEKPFTDKEIKAFEEKVGIKRIEMEKKDDKKK